MPKCCAEAKLRYRRFKEAEEDDKKNTFLPKRHAEVTAPVPKPICEERDVSAESAEQAYASVPRHVAEAQEDTTAIGFAFRYFCDFPH